MDRETQERIKQRAYDAAVASLTAIHDKITPQESAALTMLMTAMTDSLAKNRERIAEFENLTKAIITDDQVIDQYPTNGIAILVPIDKLRPLFEMVIPDGKEG